MAEVIRDRLLGDDLDAYTAYAEDIRSSGSHLLALVNDLLDISRLEQGRYDLNLERLDTGDVLRQCARMLENPAAERGVTMKVASRAPPLLADERALRQIVVNLLTNAVKFVGEQGHVTVSTSRMPDGRLAIAISDTGPGIPQEDLERVFRPFEKCDDPLSSDNRAGTGLGLAISRQLMLEHGGDLYLESSPGEGTTATAVFPVANVIDEAETGNQAQDSRKSA